MRVSHRTSASIAGAQGNPSVWTIAKEILLDCSDIIHLCCPHRWTSVRHITGEKEHTQKGVPIGLCPCGRETGFDVVDSRSAFIDAKITTVRLITHLKKMRLRKV
jgi:hypothetical protein